MMTAKDIRAEMVRRGRTGAEIGRTRGVSRQFVSTVINGHRKTPWARRAIAESIGRSYEEVWGTPDTRHDATASAVVDMSTCTTQVRP